MKKKYVAPNIEVFELKFESFLMASSVDGGSAQEDNEVIFKDDAFSTNNPFKGIEIE